MKSFWENQEKKAKAVYEILFVARLSVVSFFFFLNQFSSDLPNNTKDKKSVI